VEQAANETAESDRNRCLLHRYSHRLGNARPGVSVDGTRYTRQRPL